MHRPHRSPEKQFQSINTFAHMIILQNWLKGENRHYLLFENWILEIGFVIFFGITFFNFVNVFCQFRYYYPMKSVWLLICYSSFCVFIFPYKKGVDLHMRNSNPKQSKMLCNKFSWHWLSWSWKEGFLKFPRCFFGITVALCLSFTT